MGPLHKRIEIREETVTETDGLPDIPGTVAVHPGFCHCIVRIGRMDRKSWLEDPIWIHLTRSSASGAGP